MLNSVDEAIRRRQSRVALSGGRWEDYVKIYLNEELEGTGIEVISGRSESEIRSRSPVLWKRLCLPLKVSAIEDHVWGDIDLVAVKGDIPIAIISCKVSLHGRFTETLFWSLLYRILTRIKVVLATPDAGRGREGQWVSEWGTPENPTKDRLLAESYLDGVYVENVEEWCKGIRPGQGTIFGGIVRPLSELPEDIKKWAEEAEKFYSYHGAKEDEGKRLSDFF